MTQKINVVIWNEFRHEKEKENVKTLYPEGLHAAIKSYLDTDVQLSVSLAALDDPDQGLPDEVLENTDVLLWWGHKYHKEVDDALVAKICNRVLLGKMGFVALHSAHKSKPFAAILGTNGNLSWGRTQKEVVWNLMPAHPIAEGIPEHFILPEEELYSEPFYIPQPDALVFASWFEDGNIFRSGACFLRGAGRVFYFQPGHETCRSYYDSNVLRIIRNAVHWATPAHISFPVEDKSPRITQKVIDEFDH